MTMPLIDPHHRSPTGQLVARPLHTADVGSEPFRIFCECKGTCALMVEIDEGEYRKLYAQEVVVISRSCQTPPEPGDELVTDDAAKPYRVFRPAPGTWW